MKMDRSYVFSFNNECLVAYKCKKGQCLSRAIKYYKKDFELTDQICSMEQLLDVIHDAQVSVIDNKQNITVHGDKSSLK